MRILAIDPGTRRVGVAVSDPTGTIAQPFTTVAAEPSETLATRLSAIAKELEASRMIVGLPRRLDGSYGPEAAAARSLAAELRRAAHLPVELVDERLTSVVAERAMLAGGMKRDKRRLAADRVAAAVLLQSHLDRRHD